MNPCPNCNRKGRTKDGRCVNCGHDCTLSDSIPPRRGKARIGNVKECHNPRNEACAHNRSVECDCTCKIVRVRKPYRTLRVVDTTASYNTNPHIVMEVHPNGVLVLREARHKTRFTTNVAAIYERLRLKAAKYAAAEAKFKRIAKRKAKRS